MMWPWRMRPASAPIHPRPASGGFSLSRNLTCDWGIFRQLIVHRQVAFAAHGAMT